MSLYDPAELKDLEDNHNAKLRTTEAHHLCSTLGLTDDQLTDYWAIDLQTLLDWKLAYPAFLDAIESGRTLAPYDAVPGLYRAATGFAVQFVNNTGHKTIHVPPNSHACTFWLKHRQPDQWGA